MADAKINEIQNLFAKLWDDYTAFNPRAKLIYDLILAREQSRDAKIKNLVNDHVALRTYDLPEVSEAVLAKPFLDLGYKYGGEYFFKAKKLYARHYEHEDKSLPKVFISELKTKECSPLVQETARAIVAELKTDEIAKPRFLYSRRSWDAKYSTYQELLKESEYAAWLYAFGYRANHFTISFNHLKSFADLQELNSFIKGKGYELNAAGGEIKGTPAEMLEQSSTLAEPTDVKFSEGAQKIPACYYEFARRYPDSKGHLYQGFIAASADKIFESTNVHRQKVPGT